ncbi:helix-turn-helix domain-containing protein [Cryobacterium cryoconiti]|nr:XRE family transcriptional regulator [Cryobacterium cryoconiti]
MKTQFNPQRILAARDLLGFTLTELAEAIEVSQAFLSQVAGGNKNLSEPHAESLAQVTGLPITFFTMESPDLPSDSLRFRKNKTASSRLTRQASALFRETYRVAADLAAATALKTRPLTQASTTIESIDDTRLEDAAAAARSLLGLDGSQPILNLTRSIERLGIVVAPIILDPISEESGVVAPGHFGISHGKTDQGTPLIGYFPGSAPDRDRFTLAHELGHLVLHPGRQLPSAEDEANYFAGALLFPEAAARSLIRPDATLSQLARVKAEYGISIQALIMRAAALGILSPERKRSLFVQLSARGWRTNEPVEVAAEYPLLFRKMFDIATSGVKSVSLIEQRFGLPMSYLRSMAPSASNRGLENGAEVISLRRA